jgi:hypothetical protein
VDLIKFIEENLKDRFPNLEIRKEIFSLSTFKFKKINITQNSSKVKVLDISIGYPDNLYIKEEVYPVEFYNPAEIFAEKEILNNKVIFIKDIDKFNLKYLNLINPKLVLTNSRFKKTFYSDKFPVISIDSSVDTNAQLNISGKIKKEEIKGTNYFIDIGYGAYYFYILFPFDSFYQTKDDLVFYGTFNLLKEILRRLFEVKYPKGYRIRILFNDLSFYNYYGLKKHLENIQEKNVICFLNLEATGIGNEKLVLKNNRNFLDNFTENRINQILDSIGANIKKERLKEFSIIDDVLPDLPIIWFCSQPNEDKYKLKKEFLSEKMGNNMAYVLFSIINNLYKGII